MSNERIEKAKKHLEKQLNYGGIFVEGFQIPSHLSMKLEQGIFIDQISQMRRLANWPILLRIIARLDVSRLDLR